MTFEEALDACRNADELVDTDPVTLYRAAETLASRIDWLLARTQKEPFLYRQEIDYILEGKLR